MEHWWMLFISLTIVAASIAVRIFCHLEHSNGIKMHLRGLAVQRNVANKTRHDWIRISIVLILVSLGVYTPHNPETGIPMIANIIILSFVAVYWWRQPKTIRTFVLLDSTSTDS